MIRCRASPSSRQYTARQSDCEIISPVQSDCEIVNPVKFSDVVIRWLWNDQRSFISFFSPVHCKAIQRTESSALRIYVTESSDNIAIIRVVTYLRSAQDFCHIWLCANCLARVWTVAHTNESCRLCGWVMSHIWMSHVAHVDESCHTYEWVMSHIRMSHVAHVNGSCCIYERDEMNESCRICT